MKIGNSPDKPAVAVAASTASAAQSKTQAASAGMASAAIPVEADPSAKIELSSGASNLLSTGSSAEFDAAKVDRISSAIDQGTFKVNPGVIADKLIANAQDLLGKAQP